MDMIQIKENTNEWKSVHVLGPKIIFVPCDKISGPYDVRKNQIIFIVLRSLNLELMFYLYVYIPSERKRKGIKERFNIS